MQADRSNVNAIQAFCELKTPENKKELQRFTGMITYLSKYLPNMSDKTTIISRLLSDKYEWTWGPAEENNFQELKYSVTMAIILKYFDSTEKNIVSVDASQYGKGAVIVQ